jgi:hypothetical protein
VAVGKIIHEALDAAHLVAPLGDAKTCRGWITIDVGKK